MVLSKWIRYDLINFSILSQSSIAKHSYKQVGFKRKIYSEWVKIRFMFIITKYKNAKCIYNPTFIM